MSDEKTTTISERTNVTVGLLLGVLVLISSLGLAAAAWASNQASKTKDIAHDVDKLSLLVTTNMGNRFTNKDGLIVFMQLERDNPDLIVSPAIYELLGREP